MSNQLLRALETFAISVTQKLTSALPGEPEDQLRNPLEQFFADAVNYLNIGKVTLKGESVAETGGKPDFAVAVGGALAGHIELKSPGKGADPKKYKGHDKRQWGRFSKLPNVLYSDGNEWALYRTGELVGRRVRLPGDVATEGSDAVDASAVDRLGQLLLDFLSWEPKTPAKTSELAGLTAPLCRLLRESVRERLDKPGSPLHNLREDWRQLLFPGANEDDFADAYAQTVTFALLLARSEGWSGTSLDQAAVTLRDHHGVLGKALQILTEPDSRSGIDTALDVLIRIISRIEPSVLKAPPEQTHRLWDEVSLRAQDPWIYFYEDFLGEYDPKLRKDAGVYYTPVEVVRCQVRLIDQLLKERLGKPMGFADESVTTLDPAVGTGTYLLGVIDEAFATAAEQIGPGGPASIATDLVKRLYGFERMVGPYSVAELRISQAIERFNGRLPDEGLNVLLTDTLESPHNEAPPLFRFTRELAEQHQRALKIKNKVPILVCLGNPPYDRHDAPKTVNDRVNAGGWVRWGKDLADEKNAILQDFIKPVQDAGAGMHAKNLYNLYVYFWRWAMWKTFECEDPSGGKQGPGIVSFISASSFLMGDAFIGLRRMLRQHCDEVWIIDLGGEGRGTRKEDNVFAIQTPVCITIGFRKGEADLETPAIVHYRRIRGSRKEKLSQLNDIRVLKQAEAKLVSKGWNDAMTPAGGGAFFKWPELSDLFPWQQAGLKAGRLWPIAPNDALLSLRWSHLVQSTDDRISLFKESPTGRKAKDKPVQFSRFPDDEVSILEATSKTSPPPTVRLAYRPFDRQYMFADMRLIDRPGPPLWHSLGDRQINLTTLTSHPIGTGPSMTVSALLPDLHFFRGSFGGKDTMPLYRDSSATKPNIVPGLLKKLIRAYGREITPEDIAGYVYGVLGHAGYTEKFWEELERCEVRVPLTKEPDLFERTSTIGKRLIWLHTYGERLVPTGETHGQIPRKSARLIEPVPSAPDAYPETFCYDAETCTIRIGGQDLFVDAAGVVGPVSPEVWAFEVSGLQVVRSWLGYRMKVRKGKKSSPLDEIGPERWTTAFTTELLNLLWILEATLEIYPQQAELLDEIITGPLFNASDLPEVPKAMRKSPKASGAKKNRNLEIEWEKEVE